VTQQREESGFSFVRQIDVNVFSRADRFTGELHPVSEAVASRAVAGILIFAGEAATQSSFSKIMPSMAFFIWATPQKAEVFGRRYCRLVLGQSISSVCLGKTSGLPLGSPETVSVCRGLQAVSRFVVQIRPSCPTTKKLFRCPWANKPMLAGIS
jgi:hypothetical protein